MNTKIKSVLYTRLFRLLSFLILSPFPLYLSAQSSLEKAEHAVNVASGIAGLFKKKKKDSTATNSKQEQVTSVGGNVVIAGDILPEAKYVDVEKMYRFKYGHAIVEKGNLSTIIDPKGNTIAPYTNQFIYGDKALLAHRVKDVVKLYNSSCKMVAEINDKNSWSVNGNFYLSYEQAFTNLIDQNGNRYNIRKETFADGRNIGIGTNSLTSDSAIIVRENLKNGGSLYGLKNLSNKIIAQPKYQMIYEFLDGYAVYKTTDAYNKEQFGILNEKGIETSPRFSSSPLSMGGGYYFLKGNIESPVEYAIITPTGDIVFKEMKNSTNSYRFTLYDDGYFFDHQNMLIMDLKGTIWKQEDFLKKAGINGKQIKLYSTSFSSCLTSNDPLLPTKQTDFWNKDGFLNFVYQYQQGSYVLANREFYGLYNVKTGQVILGNYVDMIAFDPVSGLATTTKLTGKKSPNGYAEEIRGAINHDGNFVIVQKAEKKSDF